MTPAPPAGAPDSRPTATPPSGAVSTEGAPDRALTPAGLHLLDPLTRCEVYGCHGGIVSSRYVAQRDDWEPCEPHECGICRGTSFGPYRPGAAS